MSLLSYLAEFISLIAQRRRISVFFSQFPKPSRIHRKDLFDVLEFDNFPIEGVRYCITRGLSMHVLYDEDGGAPNKLRHELALATFVEGPGIDSVALLFNLGEQAIGGRRGFRDGLVYGVELSSYLSDEDGYVGLLSSYNAWLKLELKRFDVVDLFPMEEEDMDDYSHDPALFLSRRVLAYGTRQEANS